MVHTLTAHQALHDEVEAMHDAAPLNVLDDAVCVIGVFDGVHLGHRALIDDAKRYADTAGKTCVVITFSIDPDEIFNPAIKKIMDNESRIRALGDVCDDVLVLNFNEALASLTPDEFLHEYFLEAKPSDIFVGEDFRFGKLAAGDIDTLSSWGAKNHVAIHPVALICEDGKPVKSTRIRSLLAACDIETANKLLGHPYAIEGAVRHGRGDGAQLGFKTANLSIPENELLLGDGVYAGYATVDGKRYKAAISVGVSPTFEDAADNIEAHILDFEGDLYEKKIKLDFIEYLRPMIKFDNVDDLISTVMGNIEYIQDNL